MTKIGKGIIIFTIGVIIAVLSWAKIFPFASEVLETVWQYIWSYGVLALGVVIASIGLYMVYVEYYRLTK